MKNNLKKGFTIIELLVVIAMIGVLAGTVAPKLLKEMRKATVAKVQHNLGVIRSRLSLDETFLEEFPNLYSETSTDLLKTYSIESTPSFRDGAGEGHEATSKVVYSRTDDGGWEDMVDGEVYSSDTEIQYIPNEDNVSGNTNQISIGTATGDDAKLSDWGDVTGNTAVLKSKDGTIITTTVSSGELKEFNGKGPLGNGIGSDDVSSGLNKNQTLTVDVKGKDINKVVFTLDGLGSWFDENSKNATKINITAYDENDEKISTQSGYRESGLFSDTYTFEITQPVSYFVLGSEKGKEGASGNGTYVVQNVSLIKSAQDHVSLTINNPDGTTEEISKDILLDDTNSGNPITINEKLEGDE
jgi:prepilin-type N-terminal cleavage/methylation domain-containing protein